MDDLYHIYAEDSNKGKYLIPELIQPLDKEIDYCLVRNFPGVEKETLPCDTIFHSLPWEFKLTIKGAIIAPEIKKPGNSITNFFLKVKYLTMHNKILSLFDYNLESDFLKSILDENAQVKTDGSIIIDFAKPFVDKTYHIFDTISVRDFGQYSNIILSTKKFSIWKIRRYRKLINDLFKIYGPDNHNGKYSIRDFRDLDDKEMDFCLLRKWPGTEKELLPCNISLDKTLNLLELIIFEAVIDPEIKYIW